MSKSLATALIDAEVDRQDRMWGPENERADVSNRELMHAAMAYLAALNLRQEGDPRAFIDVPLSFPKGWSGFRNYGSDIANLVVATAFLHQEIARKLRAGEDHTRLSRDAASQPYTADQPKVIEA
jgi:hypothetical protein